MKELFPSFDEVQRHVNTIVFTCVQMSDPTHLVRHVYESCIQRCLNIIRTIQFEESILDIEVNMVIKLEHTRLFQLLYAESRVLLPGEPFHNPYLNIYTLPDICPLYLPSRFYAFLKTKRYFTFNDCTEKETKNQESSLVVRFPDPFITKWLLSMCHRITRHQQIRDLLLQGVICEKFSQHDLFNMSEKAQCVSIQQCELPQEVLKHLIQQLSRCQDLQYLNITETRLFEAGLWLAKSIKYWGHRAKIQHLKLCNCSVPVNAFADLFKSLSVCTSLTCIDISCNILGEAGYYLSQTLKSWSRQPTLQRLILSNCSMSEATWNELLKALASCKNLTDLDLSNNTLANAGLRLVKLIRVWEDQPLLQVLNLKNCCLPANVCRELIAAVSRCYDLKSMNIDGNTLTDTFSNFVINPHPGLRSLEKLEMRNTELSRSDVAHFAQLMQNDMLPSLESLCLRGTFMREIAKELGELIETCATHHKRELRIELGPIPYQDLERKWTKCCELSKIELQFGSDEYNWLLDDFDLD